jgi:endonuclease/exonuclease/phosphatase (EEP) superfamily protein YafD
MIALSLLANFLLVLSLLAIWVPFWPLGILAIGFPWLFLTSLGLVSTLIRWRKRRWYPWMWLPPLVGLLHLPSWLNWQVQSTGSLSVLSMNTNYFGVIFDRPKVKTHIQEVQAFLKPLKPDILCAQDYSTDSEDNNQEIHGFIRDKLGLPHRVYRTSSMSTYSRQPILAYEGQIFSDSQNSYLSVDTTLEGRPVRVFNLHLQSYQLGKSGGRLRKLRTGLNLRAEQAALVARSIAQSPYPVIVCGDLNDVPTSFAYRTVSQGLVDGFRQAGRGSAITYRGPIPGLRIDYIWCSPHLQFTRYRHLDGPKFLDHRWIWAELRWRKST